MRIDEAQFIEAEAEGDGSNVTRLRSGLSDAKSSPADVPSALPSSTDLTTLQPLMPDSELDSRPAGPVDWEGAMRAQEQGAASGLGGGKGFLELTGYLAPLKL
jgi:hypothetical protein